MRHLLLLLLGWWLADALRRQPMRVRAPWQLRSSTLTDDSLSSVGGGGLPLISDVGPSTPLPLVLSKELYLMRERVERLERSLADKQLLLGKGGSKRGSSIDAIVDTISINYLSLNARTVEVVAIVSFFFIGVIIGASLLDRLWLLGGVGFAYWASGAVHRDSRGGLIARRVGVQVTQFIRDVQEKYMQMMLFYRTGQMAYVSQVEWQKYDERFRISQRSSRALSLLAGYAQRLSKSAAEAEQRYGVLHRVGGTSKAAAGVLNKAATSILSSSAPLLSPLGLGGLSSSFSSSSSSNSLGAAVPFKGLMKASAAPATAVWAAAGRVWGAAKGGARGLADALPALQVQVEWEHWEPLKAWAAERAQAAKLFLGIRPRRKPSVNPWGAPFKGYKRNHQQRGVISSLSEAGGGAGAGAGGGLADWWGPSAKQRKSQWTLSLLGLSITVGRGGGGVAPRPRGRGWEGGKRARVGR